MRSSLWRQSDLPASRSLVVGSGLGAVALTPVRTITSVKRTEHTIGLSRTTTASPDEVYAAIADLSTFPAWWELEPHPRMEGSNYQVLPGEAGDLARPGLVIAVQRAAGGFTSRRGRTWSWEALTRRYVCEIAEPGRRLRLVLEDHDQTTLRAIDVTIEPHGLGSTVTLTTDNEVKGRGPLHVLQRWVLNRSTGHRYSLRKLITRAESPSP